MWEFEKEPGTYSTFRRLSRCFDLVTDTNFTP
jgi:hypothetical protein